MREYQTVNNPMPMVQEINDGELVTEVGSYIPAKEQIESFLVGGMALEASRKSRYDFEDAIDEDFEDPTRSKGFDMADATQIQLATEAYLNEVKKEAEEKRLSEAEAEKKPEKVKEEKSE
nr:MAG: hypothetical protein [Microvirus sp.]